MKKWSQWIMVITATMLLLVGCGTSDLEETNDQASTDEGTISVVISEEEADKIYSEDEIAIEEGAILMDVMQENYDIEEEDEFIQGIEGISPDEGEQKAWIYSVNDEEALVGAAEYELSIDDEVVFDLQSWE